jgi:diguanylate cyclase (GGDEF)-like protein
MKRRAIGSRAPAPPGVAVRHTGLLVALAVACGWLPAGPLYPVLGPQILVLAALPAITAGVLLGQRWGLALGLASAPAHAAMLAALGTADWRAALQDGWLIDVAAGLLGLLAGRAAALHGRDLRSAAALRAQVLHDALTGLPNRRFLADAWPRELHRACRQGSSLGVMLLDLDHFKQINDRYGHQAGEDLLRQVARVLTGAIRRSDIACRWGGEEFVVVLPNVTAAAALERAEILRRAIRELPAGLTVSIGIAEVPRDGTTLDAVLARADAALYAAKRAGRDRVVVYAAEHAP